jgi:hypothetical protein
VNETPFATRHKVRILVQINILPPRHFVGWLPPGSKTAVRFQEKSEHRNNGRSKEHSGQSGDSELLKKSAEGSLI